MKNNLGQFQKIDRIGEKHFNKQGELFTIIEYFGWDNCTIQFESDNSIRTKIAYQRIKSGSITIDRINRKKDGYWTSERCFNEALKFNTRNDFQKKSKVAYIISLKNNWLDDICSHMNRLGSIQERFVYRATFPDNSVYIGLTCNFERRKWQHLNEKGTVYYHMIKTNTQPIFEIISDLLDKENAAELEAFLIEEYKEKGIIILNKNKAGGLGKCNIIWTPNKIREEASKYNSVSEWKKKCNGSYAAAKSKGFYHDIACNMTKKIIHGFWTYETISEEAKKYVTRSDFKNNSSRAYQKARINGYIDEVCAHMKKTRIKNK